jgi:hypothetical protein
MDIGPVVVETPESGQVSVGLLKTEVCRRLPSLASEYEDDEVFAAHALALLIVDPNVSPDLVQAWGSFALKAILTEWTRHPLALGTNVEAEDEEFFARFRIALLDYCAERQAAREALNKQLANSFRWKFGEIDRLARQIAEIGRAGQIQKFIDQQNQIKRAFEPLAGLHTIHLEMQRSAEGIARAARSFEDAVSGAFAALEQQRHIVSNIFRTLPSPEDLARQWRVINDGAEALDESGFGFTAHVWNLPFVIEFGKLAPQVRGAVATNRLSAMIRSSEFRAELREELEESPVFARRWPIVEAAVEAHCQRNYILAIPALLAQLEGCITDLLILRGEATLYRGKLYAKDSEGKLKRGKDNKPVRLTGLDSKLSNSRWRSEDVLEAVASLLASRLIADRNGILHGRQVKYARPKLSVQCILLIWILGQETNELLS